MNHHTLNSMIQKAAGSGSKSCNLILGRIRKELAHSRQLVPNIRVIKLDNFTVHGCIISKMISIWGSLQVIGFDRDKIFVQVIDLIAWNFLTIWDTGSAIFWLQRAALKATTLAKKIQTHSPSCIVTMKGMQCIVTLTSSLINRHSSNTDTETF